MLTRLEVAGFKNLVDVTIDFGPFTCIAGENGIGKSNIFDAIQFISALSEGSMLEAAQRVRGTNQGRVGDPLDLFWNGHRNEDRGMQLAVEMLVPRFVEDDLGSTAKATSTFLRYELDLGYRSADGARTGARFLIKSESLTPITKGRSAIHMPFPHSASDFRKHVVHNDRSSGAFLSTADTENGRVINFHGDGGSRGRPQPRAAANSSRTFVSGVTTDEYPTILAARREMQSWRQLAFETSALRSADDFFAPPRLDPDGAHLAATMYRLAHDASHEQAADAYAAIAARLARLAGVNVESLDVEFDQARQLLTLYLQETGGLRLPARSLSEGTLRFLALCVLVADPTVQGLICMEEPENGIHPKSIPSVMTLLQDIAVDAGRPPSADNPLRQVIVNTHSPGVVQLCRDEDLLLAEARPITRAGASARALRVRHYRNTWRHTPGSPTFARADLMSYLTPPEGARIGVPVALAG